MNLFLSQYVNKIDKKGRVSLPSAFRNILPIENKNELILSKSLKFSAIDGCNYERINKIAERIDKLELYNVLGQPIFEKTEDCQSLDVTVYDNGIYILKVYIGSSVITEKLVVAH